jgi:hypothetical protein
MIAIIYIYTLYIYDGIASSNWHCMKRCCYDLMSISREGLTQSPNLWMLYQLRLVDGLPWLLQVSVYIYNILYTNVFIFLSLSLYISLWNSKLRQVRMPSDTIPPTNKFTLLLGVVRQLPCKEWPIRRLEFWRCSIIFPYFPYFSD